MVGNTFTWVVLVVAFSAFLIASLIVRRHRVPMILRRIEGYERLPVIIDESVEANRPVHFSPGAAAIGQETTLTALGSTEIMYYLIRRLSFGPNLPLVTMSDPITLAVAGDTLRRAYLARDNLAAYRVSAMAWYPHGERSMTFAAGAASLSVDRDVSSHILIGQFGAELAFFGEASLRQEQRFLAHSITPEGQAVAYVMSEAPLIGEEVFAGGAYLDRDNTLHVSSVITMDVLRWAIILVILIGLLPNDILEQVINILQKLLVVQ